MEVTAEKIKKAAERIRKAAPGVFFALVTVITGACEKVGLRNGGPGIVANQTTCWRYQGGKDASRLEAPLGQEDRGLVHEGAKATLTVDEETEVFGVTSGAGAWLRVTINGEDITPSKGIIAGLAEEEGITITPNLQPENQICWIKSTDFTPVNK